ncbi:MAG: hypothetical protein ING36_01525 [Burkholderiales bacterium]|jgi:hypothetical protein|nr:hypothetical protein [Burkholderiales bacterium]
MKDFAIVVCSSDQRLEFIPIFYHFLKKNLAVPEHTRIYLVGCTKQVEHPGITVFPSYASADAPWSSRILDGLRVIKEQYVFLLTEDIIFLKNHRETTIEMLYQVFVRDELLVLRIDSFPFPEKGDNPIYGLISKFSIHRISMQPSFWRREYLISLLQENESIWEFEIRGSRRTRANNKICALRSNLIPYREVIGRGYLSVAGDRLLKSTGSVRPKNLKVRSLYEECLIKLRSTLLVAFARLLLRQRKYTGL